MNQETKQCQNCKQNFTIEPEDFQFYEKIKVPAPNTCPWCRQQRRMLFRNFKTLYRRNSDRSSKPIISMYAPSSPYKIVSHDEWWSDNWDPKSFGKNFDFNRPFFDQFQELLLVVPRFAIMNVKSENCEYSNFVWSSKNCYLVFGCLEDEECAYGHIVWESKDSFDNLYLYKSEFCYETVDCLGSYRLFYSQECESCSDSIGLFDCRSCSNCIGCVGLKQKSYHIFNQPVSKIEYEKFLIDHPLTDPKTIALILEKQNELRKKVPQRHFFGSHNNNVSGNHIYNGKNLHSCFDIKGGEDSKFIFTSRRAVDSYDVGFSPDIELVYNSLTTLKTSKTSFSHMIFESGDIYYSDCCFASHHLFGCVGLRNAEYCIFNKQYSKEEYELLVPKIIEYMRKTNEYGEFFPAKLSPFAYNESIANEYMPLKKEEAIAQGFRWSEDLPSTTGKETVKHDDLPKDPATFSDELLKHTLQCQKCSRNYRFIQKEINFYKRMGLSLPNECFNCRHQRRMNMRNPRQLWSGKCAKCSNNFQTSYSLEKQKEYSIYCDKCYLEVLG